MFILFILQLAYSQLQDQQQLTEAACVIFSRYYLQNNQQKAADALAIIVEKGLNKEDGLMAMQASTVEQCLEKISSEETIRILQSLQTQNLDLESFQHLVEGADLIKYGNKKKSQKKTDVLKVIKNIDDMIMKQKKEYEDGGGKVEDLPNQRPSKRNRKGDKAGMNADMAVFDIREWAVLLSFILVGVLLSYIICCIPDRQKKKEKKIKKKISKVEEEVLEQDEKED